MLIHLGVMGLGLWMCVCVCVWSLKQRYCRDTHTHMPRQFPHHRRAFFLCLVSLTSFRDKNPPPLILFPYKSCLFSVCFDSHCYHGFYEATVTTSTITF